MKSPLGLFAMGAGLFLAGRLAAAATDLPKAQLDFFENRIRPILADNCYRCHSAAHGKPKAGLELDWKGGWEKGGDSGPPVVPGDPDKSLLIRAVRYTDPDLQMPPKGDKLTPAQIADLEAWVRMGAPDPRSTRSADAVAGAPGQGKEHWSFQPVQRPTIPLVQDTNWPENDLDRFVLARLEAVGLRPNPPADKATLLRRVYYDLIGLPPTPEEVKAFLADESPKAYEHVVDHLLSLPQYGERWGRHWLDVARYADSKGQVNRRRESSIYPYAWTYRDYVVRAFNEDKPYNRFIEEQLAADQLDLGTNRADLAALGFLTLGDHFNGNPHEIINDRIDVTTKAFLGLTVSCARCHDHKFDPIPQADYYSLYGIFASSVEPPAEPQIGPAADTPETRDYQAKRQALDERLWKLRTNSMAKVFGDYKRLTAVYLFATQLPANEREAILRKSGGDTNVLPNWEKLTRGAGRQAASVFGVWTALSRIPPARFALQAPRVLNRLEIDPRAREINPYVKRAFAGRRPRSLAEVAAIYGGLVADPDPAWQSTLAVLLNEATIRFLPNRERGQFFAVREQSDLLEMVHPGAPARATVLLDGPAPKDTPIFLRGEAENRGPIVPRRFLEVLSGPSRPVFHQGSGRLQLARAIASPSNPLTARVMVNRIWLHHFGEGFVTTPDDFGNQSAPPSDQPLLDYLASRFMGDGWSVKKLQRLIVLSAAYQESSAGRPDGLEKDPSNRLLWRANVRRLEFEPMRDSILAYGGHLNLTLGGHPVDLSEGTHAGRRGRRAMLNRVREFRLEGASRRSLYGFVDRADLLEELNTFDFANPSTPTGKRYETIVPQQALYLMNSPLVIEQVRQVVARPEFKAAATPAEKIQWLYFLFFQRAPTPEEIGQGEAFIGELSKRSGIAAAGRLVSNRAAAPMLVSASTDSPGTAHPPAPKVKPRRTLGPWQEYAHALLLSNEATFVE